jgi:hypothetical protein
MNKPGNIRFLKNHEIDRVKWDACIDASPDGLIYALSWYLDVVNPGWDALVVGDYETVMPLPVRKKYGIKYLIQPYLTQQLGVFSLVPPTDQTVELFFDFILKKYRFINISLNRSNSCLNHNFEFISKANHELYLSASYNELEKKYSRRTKRNINKAKSTDIKVVENLNAVEFTEFKVKYSNSRINSRFRKILENLVQSSIEKSVGKVKAAKDQNGEIIAAAYYLQYKERIYFSVTASSEFGKTTSAMHMLLDTIIRENAGSGKILDFTGSNMKGVAYFNEGFGAKAEKYFYIYSNRIPVIGKFMK